MKRYEEIGEAILFMMKDYPKEIKHEIKENLQNYVFKPRKKDAPFFHPNSIKAKVKLKAPKNHLEAILIIMNPLYNANTANNTRQYIIDRL